jgi:hypothetical protein
MPISPLSFTKDWTSSADFPTYEGSETQVRADLQLLFNEIKTYLNNTLLGGLSSVDSGKGASAVGLFPVTGLTDVADVQAAIEGLVGLIAAVTQGAVPDGSISTAKLADNAVEEDKIKAGAVTAGKLAALAVTTATLAAAAVTAAKLADNAVETAKIKDGAVAEGKVASGAIIASKLGAAAVETAKIKDGAVTTVKLADTAVTEAKLASASVATGKIQNGAVTSDKLAADANAATATKLATARGIGGASFDGSANVTLAQIGALPASGALVLSSAVYGDALPAAGTPGRIFFKKV